MAETCITDTGPPLHLYQIGHLRLLLIFDPVMISGHIEAEIRRYKVYDNLSAAVGDRLESVPIEAADIEFQRRYFAGLEVHLPDLSVAALAERLPLAIILTDDLALRKGLELRGRSVIGTIGVCIRAFSQGLLTRHRLNAVMDRLFDDSTLYLSRAFRVHVNRMLDDLKG